MLVINKFTQHFDAEKNQIRLDLNSVDNKKISLYMNRHLTKSLAISLLNKLDDELKTKFASDKLRGVHSFEQSIADASLRPKTVPVNIEKSAQGFSVNSLDLHFDKNRRKVIFNFDSEQKAVLDLSPLQSRQWLKLLCKTCLRANWARDIWPQWLIESLEKNKLKNPPD